MKGDKGCGSLLLLDPKFPDFQTRLREGTGPEDPISDSGGVL